MQKDVEYTKNQFNAGVTIFFAGHSEDIAGRVQN